MLNDQQIRHFETHGWVLEEAVFTADQIHAFKAALDRQAAAFEPCCHDKQSIDTVHIDAHVARDPIFLQWVGSDKIIAANQQLMGAELHYEAGHAMIKGPHPERDQQRDQLRNPDNWDWHRGLRPKWGVHPHDSDASLHHYSFLNNITYLTDVHPGCGGTAVLDGSHKREGSYKSLKHDCKLVEVSAPAGSVLHFSETLIHSGVPILEDSIRYTMFLGLTPPWYAQYNHHLDYHTLCQQIRDPVLKQMFAVNHYRGQSIKAQDKPTRRTTDKKTVLS